MILNYIACYDFETGSKNKDKTQITQISCVMIEPRKLNIINGSLFNIDVKPILDDKEAEKLGLDPVEDEALSITHKTRESLSKGIPIKEAWTLFEEYTKKYYVGKGGDWDKPIRAGFNIMNFDNPITDRMCRSYSVWDETWNSQRMFHPLHNIDLMNLFFALNNGIKTNYFNSVSLDSIRDWLGMSQDGAHDAKNDVLDCAELIIRMLKMFRKLHEGLECQSCNNNLKVQFENSMAGWKRPEV